MSLILEALRKSEAERRRGLPPDLHAELPPVPVRRVPARALWWAAGAAVLLACAAWLVTREPAQPPVAATQPASRPAASAAQLRPEPQPLPARTPSMAQTQTPTAAPAPAPATEPTTETQPAPGEAPVRAPAAAASASEASASDTPTADIATAPPDAATQRAPSNAAPADAPESAASAGDGRVLSLAELDPGTRNALPPLKLSMHLWNRDPARRFVILDGQRLGEGDRIGEASIVRIERDGVLLDWHGRGIRVPVR